MWHKVSDLSGDQRLAIESLLGRPLADDEGLNIQASQVLKDAPAGVDRSAAFGRYFQDLDRLARNAEDISDAEMEAIIDEACHHARHDRT
jgi:hypothetical protein